MKHTFKITTLLLLMFFVTQLIGLFVISQFPKEITQTIDQDGNLINITSYNLPYGLDPPPDVNPQGILISIIFALVIAVLLMLILMKYRTETFLRLWFFSVASLAIGITVVAILISIKIFSIEINMFSWSFPASWLIAIVIALPLAFFKVFRRNLIIHNATELLIYPGIAVIFVSLLNIWTVVLLLILISIYDMYAVWHSGFMQKMAKYQIQTLKVFSGFFIPYVGKKERKIIAQASKSKPSKLKGKKVKVSVAILGGGDVVFPIILAGVVMIQWGLIQALLISVGATLALAGLFWLSEKGKFYPAMPFITAGCFVALAIAYFI